MIPAPPESYVNPNLTQRQRDLVQGALRLLDREGLDGFTMRSLASEIGLSPMAAYKHFENQRELQLELWAECMLALYVDTVRNVVPIENPADAFLELCRTFVDYSTTFPNRFELLFNHPFIREVRKEDRLLKVRFCLWEYANDLTGRAQKAGLFRSDMTVAALGLASYATLHGLSYCLVSERVRFTTAMERDEAIAMGLQTIRDSLSPRPA